MGYNRHHAIVVTTYHQDRALTAREAARHIFPKEMVSPLLEAPINSWWTFIIGPDGSKEGWAESEEGDEHRDDFVTWLVAQCFEDGSNPYSWVEVQYGDDNDEQQVTRADALAPNYEWNPGMKEETP